MPDFRQRVVSYTVGFFLCGCLCSTDYVRCICFGMQCLKINLYFILTDVCVRRGVLSVCGCVCACVCVCVAKLRCVGHLLSKVYRSNPDKSF